MPQQSHGSPPKRVLNAIHYPVYGGPHNQALRLAAPLRDRGWETEVLLPDEPGNAAQRLGERVVVLTTRLHRLRATLDPRPHIGLVAGLIPEVLAIRRILRERSIGLVQICGLVNPHAALAAHAEGVPVVWQLLDTRAPAAVAFVSMMFVRRIADAVMSTGRGVALAHPGGARLENRLFPFFPPVDVELFRPAPEARGAVRLEWGIPASSPVVGCVANLNPQKGILDLIRAFAIVRQGIPDARLVLVGAEHATHARHSAEVRRLVAAAGLVANHDVVFVGERRDVERQLAGFDVFAFAPDPRGEGITTAVLEAMASGLPVVTAAVGGLRDAIEDGVDGRLVAPRDPRAMAEAIMRVLSDRQAAETIGLEARRRAVELFATEACADTHVRAYEYALGRHRG